MSAFNVARVYDETIASKHRRMASTPEVEGSVVMRDSPSFSSVYEFPLSGKCVDRTIEIGSSGDECFAEEPIFPSENELTMNDHESEDSSETNNSDSEGFIYPSDQEFHDGSDSNDVDITAGCSTPPISQCTLAESRSMQDIRSELVDIGATLVSGCCQQQCLTHSQCSLVWIPN